MTESLRARMMKKQEDLRSRQRSDKYLSLFGTIIVLAITFGLGFVVGWVVRTYF